MHAEKILNFIGDNETNLNVKTIKANTSFRSVLEEILREVKNSWYRYFKVAVETAAGRHETNVEIPGVKLVDSISNSLPESVKGQDIMKITFKERGHKTISWIILRR